MAQDAEMNATYKSYLLKPFECGAHAGECTKFGPFECLCCANGCTPMWRDFLRRHTRRAERARAFCAQHRVYPSLAVFWALGAAIDRAKVTAGGSGGEANRSSARVRLLPARAAPVRRRVAVPIADVHLTPSGVSARLPLLPKSPAGRELWRELLHCTFWLWRPSSVEGSARDLLC